MLGKYIIFMEAFWDSAFFQCTLPPKKRTKLGAWKSMVGGEPSPFWESLVKRKPHRIHGTSTSIRCEKTVTQNQHPFLGF